VFSLSSFKGKIENKKSFGVQEKCFGVQGEAPNYCIMSPNYQKKRSES